MVKLLQSNWLVALIGSVLYLGTMFMTWHAPHFARPAPPAAAASAPVAAPSWEFYNPEVEQLVADLKQQQAALATREQQLRALEVRLQAERAEINAVTQTVARLQREFDQNVVHAREEESANLRRLAKLYGAMEPVNAVAILREMTDDEIVKILAYMKDNQVTAILETFTATGGAAKRVAQISERMRVLLTRNTPDKPKS
jgi:flagellar motility protein MotE (MotC chaperone)